MWITILCWQNKRAPRPKIGSWRRSRGFHSDGAPKCRGLSVRRASMSTLPVDCQSNSLRGLQTPSWAKGAAERKARRKSPRCGKEARYPNVLPSARRKSLLYAMLRMGKVRDWLQVLARLLSGTSAEEWSAHKLLQYRIVPYEWDPILSLISPLDWLLTGQLPNKSSRQSSRLQNWSAFLLQEGFISDKSRKMRADSFFHRVFSTFCFSKVQRKSTNNNTP